MLAKIDCFLRKIVLVIGAVCVIISLFEKKKTSRKEGNEGFMTKEFDDIW